MNQQSQAQSQAQTRFRLQLSGDRMPFSINNSLHKLNPISNIRPANWSYHKHLQRCEMPTFGAFFLGREVSNSDKTIPEWVAKELLDTIQKKGKGQQDVVIGAMYRGEYVHTAYKAGGNEMAQLGVADKGIVTTSEKYTIAHSNRPTTNDP